MVEKFFRAVSLSLPISLLSCSTGNYSPVPLPLLEGVMRFLFCFF